MSIDPFSVKRVAYVEPRNEATQTLADDFIGTLRAPVEGCELPPWLEANETLWREALGRVGLVLFRGFAHMPVAQVSAVLRRLCEKPLEYTERSSPRTEVGEKVYTSTDYPKHQKIFFHNESAYQICWPELLMFYCDEAAAEGGRTPLADVMDVFDRIPRATREAFRTRGVRYVRNLSPSHGTTWQTAFQCSDKAQVERLCQERNIEFEWRSPDHLRTSSVREAVLREPATGRDVWFNHAAFFHVSTLGPELSTQVREYYGEDNLPNQTYYGDGAPIDDAVVAQLRAAYEAERVAFDWRKGDLLLINNMRFAHSRESYVGERRVWVGMGQPMYSKDFLARASD